ncbi:putative late blight resistance protein-like protein R1B-17 [Forsythia ovata]|uniref:Late blight resistance protein-like protein R1B-17 n=1 Tax=Forsythia ovata TaxID=205694 RepID=A0ABD1TUG7_9LAMI
MATSQLKHKNPVFLSSDFEDFWYHDMKNKQFETFPVHGRLIQFAALEIIGKFNYNDEQVLYLLVKNLEDSVLFCQSKTRQDYKKLSNMLLLLLQEVGLLFAVPKQQLSKSTTTYNPPGDTPLLQPSEVNLLTHIEAVLNDVGSFLYSFFFFRNQVLAPIMDLELSDLLRKFELLEAKIEEHCIAVSKMPSCTTRKTAVVSLFIVDSLLYDLTHLLNHKADKIFGQHPELEELVIQTTDIVYEIEHVINSFPPVWYLTLRLPQFMDKIKHIMMGIKETKNNIDTGIVQVENCPTEQVSSQEKGSLILENIVVGFDNKETEIAEQLVTGPQHLQIISIFGMLGVGKTTLAKKLYNNPSVVYRFDKRAWCVISQTYSKRNVFIDILRSVNDSDKETIMEMDDESLVEAIHKSLIKWRYIIVVDDIWDINAWNVFGRYFPDDTMEVESYSPLGTKKLRKVFQKEHCPQELVDIGKQIAANCHGLPLAVVVIAAVLEKCEMKEHIWLKVAKSLSSVISEDPNKFGNILELSFKHLPMHLKPCFLYFGAFEEDKKMSVKELMRLWVGGGFIKKKEGKSSEDVAYEYLVDLIDRTLIQFATESHKIDFTALLYVFGTNEYNWENAEPCHSQLRVGSFEGNQWNTTEGEFQQLKVLELSLVNNTEWNAPSDPFPRLERPVLSYCYCLEKDPLQFL